MIFPIVLTTALSILGIVAAFFRKWPAAVISFAGMLVPHLADAEFFTSGTLWFWGVAAAIVTANMYMSDLPPVATLRYYTLGGCLVGTVVGAVLTAPAVGVIVGAFVGAVLGFIAFRRTPAGQMNATMAQTLTIFADVAIPGAIAFCISVLTLSNLI